MYNGGPVTSEDTMFPWYVTGLAFACVGCGRCCAGPETGYVWATDEEIAAMADHLGLAESKFRRRYIRKVGDRYSLKESKPSRDCVFLQPTDGKGRRCAVYPVRPSQCRTWPFWPQNLANSDSWARAGLRCRGINRGEVHTWNEIERIRNPARE